MLPPHRPHPDDLIDMTAMVDIVFFLLIFFLVTSLQALESVMNLPTPQSAGTGVSAGRTTAELENDPNFITVRIEEDDSIWVEDTQVFNDQDLNVRLRAARQAADGPRSLLVVGDADASHGAAVRRVRRGGRRRRQWNQSCRPREIGIEQVTTFAFRIALVDSPKAGSELLSLCCCRYDGCICGLCDAGGYRVGNRVKVGVPLGLLIVAATVATVAAVILLLARFDYHKRCAYGRFEARRSLCASR